MKIAYIGKTEITDSDFALLAELQRKADVTYFIEVSPRYKNGSAINISEVARRCGIFKASLIYPEFCWYSHLIDLNKVYVTNTYGRFWLLQSLWVSFLLILKLRRGKFDIIHTAWPYNFYEYFLYVFRRKTVLTLHDPIPHSSHANARVANMRRRKALRNIHNIILLNDTQRQEFVSHYHLPKDTKIHISRLGCYSFLNEFRPKAINRRGNYILFFGKITKYKGIEYLLQAFSMLNRKDIKLVIAGNGDFYFDIAPYEHNPQIEFLHRFIPTAELATLIANSLFCVCPYTDATQSGVMMSAFAFNKTVLATSVGALPVMLGNGKYGKLVPPRDAQALATAMSQLLDDKDLLHDYEAAIENDYHKGYYSWEAIANHTLEIYQDVINQKP